MYTAVKPLSKYLQPKSVRIYDGIFSLHAKCTCALLLAFTLLLTSKQLFGDPLVCLSDMKESDYVNSHCWTMGTYIMNYTRQQIESVNKSQLNPMSFVEIEYAKSFPNRKLDRSFQYNMALLLNSRDVEPIYQRYYQWVVPVLLLQSFIFYLPAFLWKIWEGGRLKILCADLDNVLESQAKIKKQVGYLVKYFRRDYKETHRRYFISYVLCEVLNFAISIINMLLLDVFLNGFWSQYVQALGAVPAYNWDEWNRIMTHIFPKITKCEILKYGFSGSEEYRDNLCLMTLNHLNEKIFLFLWVWFIAMAILAGMKLLHRLLIIFNSKIRFQLLRVQAGFMSQPKLKKAICCFTCGDWFVLMRIGHNISPELFKKLLNELSESICTKNEIESFAINEKNASKESISKSEETA